MKVVIAGGQEIELGTLETTPTVGITDFSRRTTDDYGVTTVVKRDFKRELSLRFSMATEDVDAVQQQLAGLRATSAQWVADDRFAWLSPTGFYKDFELDFQTDTLTYCRLTIEGLAESEPGTDTGVEAAPAGTTSTMFLLQAADVTDAVLASSTIAENDYAAWDAETGYPAGTRVISTATHRVYESTAALSMGENPTTPGSSWIDVGPTNRWAMFDQALGTLTSGADEITVVLNAASINALALLDVTGSTVRLQSGLYDRTLQVGEGTVTFLGLPDLDGEITVTIAGAGTVSVGTLLLGQLVTLGITETTPTAGINDYSKKNTDDFGVVTVVPRSWAKTMAVKALISTDAVDVVANRVALVRAQPSLWIADSGTDSLTVYGFFKDFSIEVAEEVSTLSLSIEGLSEAADVSGGLADLADALRIKVQWSSDGLGGDGASAWHDAYVDGQDFFMRQSTDDGATWGPALRAVASDGLTTAQVFLYQRAADAPAVPSQETVYTFATGALTNVNNGWSQAIPDDDGQPLWVTAATANSGGATDAIEANEWAAPVILAQNGQTGPSGLSAKTIFLYQRAANAPAVPSQEVIYTFATAALAGVNNGWGPTVPATNGNPCWVTTAEALSAGTNDTIEPAEWAAPTILAQDGEDGTDGVDGLPGLNVSKVFLYQRSIAVPAPPSTESTYTFATAVLTGFNNGWSQSIPGSNGQALYVTVATASSTGSSDTIAANEWAAPVIMAQDGSGGAGSNGINSATVYLFQRSAMAPAVPDATTSYTFASGVLSGIDNGWSQSVPTTNGLALWVTTATALSTGSTDDITAAEWAAPSIMAQDGTAAISVGLSTYSVTVAADNTGATKVGALPKTANLVVLQGDTDITSGCTVALTPSSADAITASYAGGVVSVTKADSAGYVDVAVSKDGTLLATPRLQIVRNVDPQPPGSTTGEPGSAGAFIDGTGGSSGSFNTTSDVPTIILRANASGQLRVIFTADYSTDDPNPVNNYNFTAQAKAIIRVAGSGAAFGDFGAAVTGTTSTYSKLNGGETTPGSVSLNQTASSLTANAQYEIGFVLRKSSGTIGNSASADCSYSVSQP